jgi:mortality factor 4-like protein 1
MLKLTEENQKKQEELASSIQANKKAAPVQKIVDNPTQKKRRRESLVEKEGEFLKKPEIKISVPENLKSQLVEDWEHVTKNQKLLMLPAKQNVNQILDEFYSDYLSNLPNNELYVMNFI